MSAQLLIAEAASLIESETKNEHRTSNVQSRRGGKRRMEKEEVLLP
jgi:hypothetical protein